MINTFIFLFNDSFNKENPKKIKPDKLTYSNS